MNDRALIAALAAATLTRDEWGHREQLRVTYLYLRDYPREEALERLRDRIQNLHAAHGTPDGLRSGYHETTTQAWLRLVEIAMSHSMPDPDSDAFIEAHPELLEPHVLRLFYSSERLLSPEAQRYFIEPDLALFRGREPVAPVPERRILELGGTLTLRPVESADAAAVFAAVQHSRDEFAPWLSWCDAAYGLEQSIGWTSRQTRAWATGEEFAFVIEAAGESGVIGACGLNALNWQDRLGNLGYWIRTDQAGRGIAAQAARRVARFGLDELRLERIEIVAAVGNLRSQRVAVKAGATREAVLRRRSVVGKEVRDAVLFSFSPGEA
ncbi:MAG TPA: GNAT family protein [Chthoniobacteraceae bacterium]|nr:GNAT family protein [Chthoniobacteraceae bacterium]